MTQQFYDSFASTYHLIYPDWKQTIAWQAETLDQIIRSQWTPQPTAVLDVACGIGTQSLGLAQMGYRMTGSDLSLEAVKRARQEALGRSLDIQLSVADMRHAQQHHKRQFDLVLACDNAIPHLLSDRDISQALQAFYDCIRPGGGVLISVRDYDLEDKETKIKAEGVRYVDGVRHVLLQVWEFSGEIYDLIFYVIKDEGGSICQTEVKRTRYYAVGLSTLVQLMQDAGFDDIEVIRDVYFQPVIVGTRPA